MATVTHTPTGAGDLTEFTNQYPASTYHWDKVDDAASDGNSTYIYSTAAAYKTDLYTHSPTLLGGKINSVVLHAVARKPYSVGSAVTLKNAIKVGGTVYYGAENTLAYSASYADYTTTYTTSPATGGPWSWSEIYTMQIGVAEYAQDSRYAGYVTRVYAVTDYTLETVRSNFAMGDCGVF